MLVLVVQYLYPLTKNQNLIIDSNIMVLHYLYQNMLNNRKETIGFQIIPAYLLVTQKASNDSLLKKREFCRLK